MIEDVRDYQRLSQLRTTEHSIAIWELYIVYKVAACRIDRIRSRG